MGWQNITPGGPGVSWVENHTRAFNGNVSVTLRTGTGRGPRVGVAARGLYHHGYRLHANKNYVGYIAVTAARPSTLHVRLEDWNANLTAETSDINAVLSHNVLHHPGDGVWRLFNLSLTPNASTSCVPFPFGKPPLYCAMPRSQVANTLLSPIVHFCILFGLSDCKDGGANIRKFQTNTDSLPGECDWDLQGLRRHSDSVDRRCRNGGEHRPSLPGAW